MLDLILYPALISIAIVGKIPLSISALIIFFVSFITSSTKDTLKTIFGIKLIITLLIFIFSMLISFLLSTLDPFSCLILSLVYLLGKALGFIKSIFFPFL